MIGTALIAGGSVVAAASSWYLAPMAARKFQELKLRNLCAATKSLVLTYDDGPGEKLTPQLLDLLKSRNARATFFLTGFRATDNPELVDEIAGQGHEIACHTQQHLNAWRTSPWRSVHDIDEGYQSLARWVPQDGWFRPPFGKLTLLTWARIKGRKAPLGWWTICSGDDAEVLPNTNTAANKAKRDGGGVVLLHDFDRSQQRAEFMLESTSKLLDAVDEQGWLVRTLSELTQENCKRAASYYSDSR